jgi:hypothetical protein
MLHLAVEVFDQLGSIEQVKQCAGDGILSCQKGVSGKIKIVDIGVVELNNSIDITLVGTVVGDAIVATCFGQIMAQLQGISAEFAVFAVIVFCITPQIKRLFTPDERSASA